MRRRHGGAQVIYDTQTGNSKGFGFVTFVDAATALAVKSQGKVDMYGKQVGLLGHIWMN